MQDNISKIDQRITQLKQKKEKLKTQRAILLFKEAQIILGEHFSTDLVLNVLFHSWISSSFKQKEEWIDSSNSFRESATKGKSKKVSNLAKKDFPTSTENP